MSRRSSVTKARRQAARPEKVAASSVQDAADESAAATRPSTSRNGLYVAAAVNGAWIVALLSLAALTANPLTFNREQIARADFVATVSAENLDENRFSVEKEWKHGAELGTITIANFHQVRGDRGQRLIVPLTLGPDGAFRVTRTRLPDRAPLVYPRSPQAARKLQGLLNRLAAPADNDKLPGRSGFEQSDNSN